MKPKLQLFLGFILVQMLLVQPLFSMPAGQNKEQGKVTFVDKSDMKQVDVLMDGKLFTSYIWPDHVMKPVLYPVITSSGTEVTRGFPLKPGQGREWIILITLESGSIMEMLINWTSGITQMLFRRIKRMNTMLIFFI